METFVFLEILIICCMTYVRVILCFNTTIGLFRKVRDNPQLSMCAKALFRKHEYVGMRVHYETGVCEGLPRDWAFNETMDNQYSYVERLQTQQFYNPLLIYSILLWPLPGYFLNGATFEFDGRMPEGFALLNLNMQDCQQRRESSQELLEVYSANPEDFHTCLATGDETWLHHWDQDTKKGPMHGSTLTHLNLRNFVPNHQPARSFNLEEYNSQKVIVPMHIRLEGNHLILTQYANNDWNRITDLVGVKELNAGKAFRFSFVAEETSLKIFLNERELVPKYDPVLPLSVIRDFVTYAFDDDKPLPAIRMLKFVNGFK